MLSTFGTADWSKLAGTAEKLTVTKGGKLGELDRPHAAADLPARRLAAHPARRPRGDPRPVRAGGESQASGEVVLAASVIATLPMLVIFFIGQRYFVEGIATTGRKG